MCADLPGQLQEVLVALSPLGQRAPCSLLFSRLLRNLLLVAFYRRVRREAVGRALAQQINDQHLMNQLASEASAFAVRLAMARATIDTTAEEERAARAGESLRPLLSLGTSGRRQHAQQERLHPCLAPPVMADAGCAARTFSVTITKEGTPFSCLARAHSSSTTWTTDGFWTPRSTTCTAGTEYTSHPGQRQISDHHHQRM